MLDKKELQYEQYYLQKVLSIIESRLTKTEELAILSRHTLTQTQKDMWENVSATPNNLKEIDSAVQAQSYLDDIKNQTEQFIALQSEATKLRIMLSSPYFARIDFKEEGEDLPDKIYIGIASLTDDFSDFYIFDWRAPISSLFYEFETGSAFFDAPDGKICGDICLKRQYRIENGDLKYAFDSNLVIEDDILQDILSSSTNTQMRNIVATIQKEQNKVIRDDLNDLLLVQGPAGSGKTSVALHRIAWILYKHKKHIDSKNILVISPNNIFNEYISDVLPSLGEDNMQQLTYKNILYKLLGNEFIINDYINQTEYMLTESTDSEDFQTLKDCIEFKSSPEFKTLIEEYVYMLEQEPFPITSVSLNQKILISEEKLKHAYRYEYDYLPVKRRIEKLKNRILKTLNKIAENYAEKISIKLQYDNPLIDKKSAYEEALSVAKDIFIPIGEGIKEKYVFHAFESYYELFQNSELLSKIANVANIVLPKNIEKICSYTISMLDIKTIPYEDTAPLLLLMSLAGDLKSNRSIKHLVIDEGQDYYPLQISALKKIYPDAGFTILGDPTQSINPYVKKHAWSEFISVFKEEKTNQIKFTKSYRSTYEISEFANALVLYGNYECVNRHGDKPQIVNCGEYTQENILKSINFIAKLTEQESTHHLNSMAIITKNEIEGEALYDLLKMFIPVQFVNSSVENLEGGICVIPITLAKGLEFDSVVFFNASQHNYLDFDYSKLFYTACSRALHSLYVLYFDRLADNLKNIDEKLYDYIEI